MTAHYLQDITFSSISAWGDEQVKWLVPKQG
jgi:hypothetical protein